jgi:dTDP-4-dehydrorhamnose reductase
MFASIPTEMKPKILLIGKGGQVGRELSLLLPSFADVVALGHSQLDIGNCQAVRQAIQATQPRIIVNAAAYTAVDRAESDEAKARAINAVAPAVMAEEAKTLGALLVHYSTDYVFDGTKRTPYVEEDPPNPLSAYGRTKLAGEQAIQQSGAEYLIFRTAWVYARQGRNFLLTIMRLATQREELKIVNDQIGSPTFAGEIAANSSRIIEILYRDDADKSSVSTVAGVYHMTAAGETSWYEFAKAILDEISRSAMDSPWLVEATNHRPLIARRVTPIETREYPTPARRPSYSVLSNERLARVFGVHLPDWRAQLHSAFCGDFV